MIPAQFYGLSKVVYVGPLMELPEVAPFPTFDTTLLVLHIPCE